MVYPVSHSPQQAVHRAKSNLAGVLSPVLRASFSKTMPSATDAEIKQAIDQSEIFKLVRVI